MIPGLRFKQTARGICVATIDNSVRIERDAAWELKMRGVLGDEKFNREFGLSWETGTGKPVLKIEPALHVRKVAYIEGKAFWRGWDFGYRRPACMVTQMNPFKEQWIWFWGVVGKDEDLRTFAKRVFEICDARFPIAKDIHGKPKEQYWLEYCDPAGTQRSDKSDTTSIEQLEDEYQKRYRRPASISFNKLEFHKGISRIRERLLIRNDGEPGLVIADDFEDAIDALKGGYRYPDDKKSGDQSEFPLKDGYYIHLMDCARYIANCEFTSAGETEDVAMEQWDKLIERLNIGLNAYTGY